MTALPRHPRRYRFGPFTLDPLARELQAGGQSVVPLSSTELDLLHLLVKRGFESPGTPVTRDELSKIWPVPHVEANTIAAHLTRLRKKVEKAVAPDATRWFSGFGMGGVQMLQPVYEMPAGSRRDASAASPAESAEAADAGARRPESEWVGILAELVRRSPLNVEAAVTGVVGADAVSTANDWYDGPRPPALPSADVYDLSPACQAILDALPIPIFYKDTRGRYRGMNVAFEAFLGRRREEILNMPVWGVSMSPEAAKYRQMDNELFATRGFQVYSHIVNTTHHNQADQRTVVFRKGAFDAQDATVAGLVGAIVDITDDSQDRARLLAEIARLRALSEGFGAGIVIHEHGVVRDLNRTCARMFGYDDVAQLVAQPIHQFIAERSLPIIDRHIRLGLPGPYRVTGRRRDDSEFPIEIRGGEIDYGGRPMRRAVITQVLATSEGAVG